MAEQKQCETAQASRWLEAHFADAEMLGGTFDRRVEVETPVLVKGAALSGVDVGFSIRRGEDETDLRAAFSDVTVSDLLPDDIYGSAIRTNRSDPGVSVFLVDVTLRPRWPSWRSYSETNFDGLTLDAAAGLYAQSLTVSDWNADAAIDSKAVVTQLVDLTVTGPGHRPLRLWRSGPHYLVTAQIDKPGGGTLVWFRDCDTAVLRVYNSRFDGAPRLSPEQISCDTGTDPQIVYLTEDPRLTGEMHPMFQVCGG